MTTETIMMLVQESLKTAALVAGPILIAGMVTGLLMSVFQTVTSIQEQTLTFVPKVAACLAVVIVALPWQIQTLSNFTTRLFEMFSSFGH